MDTTIGLPPSKSISNRALVICGLTNGGIAPWNLSSCDDTEVIVNALRSLPPVVDIKAAGTAMRFMTAFLSVTPGTHVITGTERMKRRPIGILVDALRKLGADIEYTGEEGFPPLRVTGRELSGGDIDMPGTISSQYVTALLLIGPMLDRGLRLRLTGGIISRPYIDLTIHIMHDFGAAVEWTDIDTIEVEPVPYTARQYRVENDWSAASYWYEAIALSPRTHDTVRLTGLIDGSRQGDSVARYLFSMLGVKTSFAPAKPGEQTTVTLRKMPSRLRKLEYDFINQPDMAQTFVVCCALLGIPFRFTGLASLRIKETDRIEAMKDEMRKLGYVITDGGGSELIWQGERCAASPKPVIETYEDHRMAMAFAPAAMRIPEIRINDPHVVTKSYPRYWDDMRLAGFTITEE